MDFSLSTLVKSRSTISDEDIGLAIGLLFVFGLFFMATKAESHIDLGPRRKWHEYARHFFPIEFMLAIFSYLLALVDGFGLSFYGSFIATSTVFKDALEKGKK